MTARPNDAVRVVEVGCYVTWATREGQQVDRVVGVRRRSGFTTGILVSQQKEWLNADMCRITSFPPEPAETYRQPVADCYEILEGRVPLPVPTVATPSLDTELQGAVLWHTDLFPQATAQRITDKLHEELDELIAAPNDGNEIADVLIVLAVLADKLQMDLATAVRRKMEVNRKRKWQADGTREGKNGEPRTEAPHSSLPLTETTQYRGGTLEGATIETTAPDILDEARSLVNGDRRTEYGPLLPSFRRIATMWSAVFDMAVTPKQVALAMVCLKACRSTQGYKRDSLVDMAAYAYIIQRLEDESVQEVAPK